MCFIVTATYGYGTSTPSVVPGYEVAPLHHQQTLDPMPVALQWTWVETQAHLPGLFPPGHHQYMGSPQLGALHSTLGYLVSFLPWYK